MSPPSEKQADLALADEPGHLIRRAQQIAVSTFSDVHGRRVTPVQYAILRTLDHAPGIDQVTLAEMIALDTSTTADIAARLETKGLIIRAMLPRRQRSLSLTPAGQAMLEELRPGVQVMYDAMMAHLTTDEQREFMLLLRKFVGQTDTRDDQSSVK
jgi:MarR family transcriptional regulator, temperature-dependent positive regulator of motility